jgi:hypothetical protein
LSVRGTWMISLVIVVWEWLSWTWWPYRCRTNYHSGMRTRKLWQMRLRTDGQQSPMILKGCYE